eukprot:1680486-Prymnesium_polylepis.1
MDYKYLSGHEVTKQSPASHGQSLIRSARFVAPLPPVRPSSRLVPGSRRTRVRGIFAVRPRSRAVRPVVASTHAAPPPIPPSLTPA